MIKNINPLGYEKYWSIYKTEKFYVAKIGTGMPVRARLLRRKFNTASRAEAYAQRVVDRYNRLIAQVQP